MHRDVAYFYATHHLCVIDDADLVLWRYEILSDRLAATFSIKYCSLLGLDLDC